ncbi:MAG: site-specific integrase [Alphaproteobacteria bacterium]
MMTERISALRRRMIEDMTARQLSSASQRSHIRSCKRFAAFLGRSPETATREDIRQFQLYLAKEAVSITTRNAVMSGVKFLFRVTLRRLDLAEEIYHLNEPQKAPVVMSVNEVKRLLAVARPLKAKVMLSVAYGTGMRAGEVCRLKVGDIDSDQMIIRVVQGKGKKDRQVALPKDLLGLLRAWWPVRSKRLDAGTSLSERWLFPGGKDEGPTSARQLGRLFQETARMAGITRRVTLHSLRHSFATHLLEAGVDIRIIQAMLGHSKLDVTARYTRVATKMIAKVESPLDRLTPKPRRRAKGKAPAPA